MSDKLQYIEKSSRFKKTIAFFKQIEYNITHEIGLNTPLRNANAYHVEAAFLF